MIRYQEPSSVAAHTTRYSGVRAREREAGRTLAHAAADIGDCLKQIKEELKREGLMTWTEWLEHQFVHDEKQGFVPIDDRRAREYMAVAKFREDAGERFKKFVRVSFCCILPVLTLKPEHRERLLAEGVRVANGEIVALEDATRDQIRAAVAELEGAEEPEEPAPAPSRERQFAALLKKLKALGELSADERAKIAAAAALPPQTTDARLQTPESRPSAVTGAGLARRSLEQSMQAGLSTGATAPVESGASPTAGTAKAAAPVVDETTPEGAPQPPIQTYQGRLGPVTLTNGYLVLGTLDRTALADQVIAALRQMRDKVMLVNSGSGKLASGRKTEARKAVEAIRLAVNEWPAWS